MYIAQRHRNKGHVGGGINGIQLLTTADQYGDDRDTSTVELKYCLHILQKCKVEP